MNKYLHKAFTEIEPLSGSLHSKYRRIYISSAIVLLLEISANADSNVALFGLKLESLMAWHIEALCFLVLLHAILGATLLLFSVYKKSSIEELLDNLKLEAEDHEFSKYITDYAKSDIDRFLTHELKGYQISNFLNLLFHNIVPVICGIFSLAYSAPDFWRLIRFILSSASIL